jgi:hypothetical protein
MFFSFCFCFIIFLKSLIMNWRLISCYLIFEKHKFERRYYDLLIFVHACF